MHGPTNPKFIDAFFCWNWNSAVSLSKDAPFTSKTKRQHARSIRRRLCCPIADYWDH